MSRFATGVTIVTTHNEDGIHGFTVNAFSSVTTEPPSVLICVNRSGQAHSIITQSHRFCVNILGLEQQELAERFAGGRPQERFYGVTHRQGPSGSPILDGVLGYVDCEVDSELTARTHSIFIGKVLEAFERAGAPLGYYDRRFRNFSVEV